MLATSQTLSLRLTLVLLDQIPPKFISFTQFVFNNGSKVQKRKRNWFRFFISSGNSRISIHLTLISLTIAISSILSILGRPTMHLSRPVETFFKINKNTSSYVDLELF